MADSVAESFGKVVIGGVTGFALYLLVSSLGLGGGRGDGRGDEGRGEGRDETTPPPPPTPPTAPPLSVTPSPPPRPKDKQRLSFVMIEPKVLGNPMGFRLRDGDPKKIYSLDEMIARIKEGGRTDVELHASGAVIQGPWNIARDLITRAGITVWLAEAPPTVSGADTRGQYAAPRRVHDLREVVGKHTVSDQYRVVDQVDATFNQIFAEIYRLAGADPRVLMFDPRTQVARDQVLQQSPLYPLWRDVVSPLWMQWTAFRESIRRGTWGEWTTSWDEFASWIARVVKLHAYLVAEIPRFLPGARFAVPTPFIVAGAA